MFISVSSFKSQVETISGISNKSMDNPQDCPLIDRSAPSNIVGDGDEDEAGGENIAKDVTVANNPYKKWMCGEIHQLALLKSPTGQND